jgi:hypothetical protein
MKVTVYKTNEFFGNINKIEITLDKHYHDSYAQYKSLLHVVGTPKRKRTKYVYREQGFKPFLVVAKGWNLPDPDSMWGSSEVKENATIQSSKYRSHDDGFIIDFLNNQYKELDVLIEAIHSDYKAALQC